MLWLKKPLAHVVESCRFVQGSSMRCRIVAVHVLRPCPIKAEDEACCFEEIVVFRFYSMVFVRRCEA